MSTLKSSGIVKTLASTLSNAVTKFFKQSWLIFGILIIIAALVSSLFRALTPWASQYKPEVEQYLSSQLGKKVTISSMETGWYWFEPVIRLKNVSIEDANRDVLKLKRMLVGINLFSSLIHWQIQPGILSIESAKLTIRQQKQGWEVDGFERLDKTGISWEPESYTPILAWILAQQKIMIKNLTLQIYLQDGTLIPVRNLNLIIGKRQGIYKVKGSAYLKQYVPTSVQLMAELDLDPYKLKNTQGDLYIQFENIMPTQWQGLLPNNRYKMLDGEGDVQLWMTLHSGKPQIVQARVDINKLSWTDLQTHGNYNFDVFKANLSWNQTDSGWELTGDNINLRLDGRVWPQNKVLVRYQKQTNFWKIYVQKILIESLLALDISWPENMHRLLALKPQGILHDVQLQIKENSPAYILTQFSRLSWQAGSSLPAVSNLSGVLHWQPDEGRLELDSENTTIKIEKKPAIHFKSLNLALDWKELSHGLRVSLERFVLQHRDLLFNATGVVDDIEADSVGNISFNGAVSATDAHQWLKYIPSGYLKKKLEVWLQRDVKRIDKMVAEININGPGSDFPFDKNPGEFKINSHFSGVDLIFAPNWPVTKDIEAYVQVDKRTFNADVVYANLQGILIDQANLIINDLGLNHETLLVHGKVNTNSSKSQNYILSTPLGKKLSALKKLQMQGPVSLDMQLEAPLYPENDDILALGDISFTNNTIKVNHILKDIEVNEMNGSLQFDQEGVLDSSIHAMLFNNPVSLLIQSIRNPNPRTEVKIKAKTSIETLRKKLNLAIFELMRGDLWLEGLLILTDDTSDLDQFQIKSSLRGVAINMPVPLGKKESSKEPLTIDIAFNPDKAIHFKVNYSDKLGSDIWLINQKGQFQLQKGEIHIGKTTFKSQNQAGLQIVGSLPTFDLKQWLAVFAKLPATDSKKGFGEALRLINLHMGLVTIASQSFADMNFKASRLTSDSWALTVNQAKLAANLKYSTGQNALSGTFSKLHLDKAPVKLNAETSNLKVSEIPNLDIKVADLRYGVLNLGGAAIKTTRQGDAWLLDNGKINSPYYQLNVSGKWQQNTKVNQSRIQANMQITDLARSLEQWHISPVVEASRGNVKLTGTWPGSFMDFSLSKLQGDMAVEFKNGRITDLSPETEEKLGLGKLLSILSLQTIPRRLKLDFSDLANKGYSFDVFKGQFKLANGVMSTEDSYIDGPVAYASMKGRLDVARQLYDLDLRVSPHITASLPLVATIAGGPIAGIATWVASKIINKGMQKISAYTYKISGPWKQPVVQQVHIFKKLERQ